MLLFTGSAISLCLDALAGARLDELFLVSGAGFTALYILGSGAAIKLLKLRGLKRIFPYVSLVVSIVVFIFVGEYALFPLAIILMSIVWTWFARSPTPERRVQG
jgi:hypothetical protein